ncbi:hypothetical protein C6501_11095 [Candidatus Poribacteria bacterium]|nr:MAG: hypothetical protein C6501_11095 [Candidatus Poribacteria bacterium]
MFFLNFLQTPQIENSASDPQDPDTKKDFYYAFWVTAVFLLVCGYGAIHHEMWRDEIQAWLLARDSASVFELFANMKYEGHPALWHLCLMPLSRISASPIMMQVFHLLIAATTVFLFTRYAPFNKIQKLLFCFGYFALYEYAIVARNYALGVLLITIFCILYRERYKRFLWIGIVLILLAHTSVHALIVTIAIGFALMCEYLYFYCYKKEALTENKRYIWIGFALIGFGIVTSVLQLKPPADYGFAVGWHFKFEIQRVFNFIKIITQAMLPSPRASMGFWGSHQLNSYEFFQSIRLPICFFIVLWCVIRFLKRPTALFIYLIATVGLLAFFYVKYGGSIRHHGFLFFTFVLSSWIYYDCPEINFPFSRISRLAQWFFGPIFTVILVVHFLGGITAIRMDTEHIFSNGKRTAEYIKAQGRQDMLMVGHGDPQVSTVVGYLEKDQVYYPRGSRFGSFVRWDKARTGSVSNRDVVKEAKMLSTQNSQDVLIIMSSSLNVSQVEEYQLTLLEKFTGSTVGDEGFHLYLMKAP